MAFIDVTNAHGTSPSQQYGGPHDRNRKYLSIMQGNLGWVCICGMYKVVNVCDLSSIVHITALLVHLYTTIPPSFANLNSDPSLLLLPTASEPR